MVVPVVAMDGCKAPPPRSGLEVPTEDTGAPTVDDGSDYGAFGITIGALRGCNGSHTNTQEFSHQDALNPTASGVSQAHVPYITMPWMQWL